LALNQYEWAKASFLLIGGEMAEKFIGFGVMFDF
jgi:hypothetical protein